MKRRTIRLALISALMITATWTAVAFGQETNPFDPSSGFVTMPSGFSRAEDIISQPSNRDYLPDLPDCGIWGSLTSLCGLTKAMAIIAYIASTLTLKFVDVANNLFNIAVDIGVRKFSTYAELSGVKEGWRLARDFANSALIFILLYVAAAIILQLSSVGGKRLVVKVIIMALLINFSAFITRVVIDASNVTANQFYSMAGGNQTATAIGSGGAPDIATQLHQLQKNAAGLNVSREELEKAKTAGQKVQINLRAMIAAVMQSILNIIAAVALGAGGLMMLVRTIVLIFLIILSPLAFLFLILPQTSGWAGKWSQRLVNEALFAPAFLFMFAMAVKIAGTPDNSAFKAIIDGSKEEGALGLTNGVVVAIIVNGMIVASLIIAKSFGAAGASGAMGALKRMRGFATGALVGGAAGVAGGWWAGRLGRGIKHQVQQGIGALERNKSPTAQRIIGTVPGLRAGMQRAAIGYRADVGKKQEKISQLRTGEMVRRLEGAVLPTTRAAMLQEIAKREDLDQLSVEQVRRGRKLLAAAGMSTLNIDKFRPDAGETPAEIEEGVAKQKQPDISKLHRGIVSGKNADDVINAMINQYDGGMANATVRRGDAIANKFLDELLKRANAKAGTTGQRSSQQITSYLEEDILRPITAKATGLEAKTSRTKEEEAELDKLRIQAGKVVAHARSYQFGNVRRDAGLDEFAAKGIRGGGSPSGGGGATAGGGPGGGPPFP